MTETLNRPQIYTIVFLRHGESVGNAQGIHQGQADFPLSEIGENQARALSRRWQKEGIHFAKIISSPLTRARETAEIIAAATGSALEINPLWMERNVGLYSGLTPEEGHKIFPPPAFTHPYQPFGKTGESQWELFLRAGRAIQELINHPPGKYLVISHGGILNMAMYAILGIIPQANFIGPRFRFANTGFATLTYNPSDHTWRLIGINDIAHLERENPELVGLHTEPSGIEAGEEPVSAIEKEPDHTSKKRVNSKIHFETRLAQLNDIDGLVNLYIEINDYHWSAMPDIFRQPEDVTPIRQFLENQMTDPQTGFYLAEVDRKPVGFVIAQIRNAPDNPVLAPRHYGLIDSIIINQAYRGNGIGQVLMERACQWFQEQGITDIELNVYEFNQSAIQFYERLGYSTLSQKMRKIFPDGNSASR